MEKNTKEWYGKILGPLEHDLLEILWADGEVSGREIFSKIKRSRAIALTTVLTVLERLVKKGMVSKAKGETVYTFKPVYTKEEFARKISNEVLKSIFEISTAGTAASFIDMLADIHPAELDMLTSLINRKKKEFGIEKG